MDFAGAQAGAAQGQPGQSTSLPRDSMLQPDLRWDTDYIKTTTPGMLKVAALVIDLVVWICVMCTHIIIRGSITALWFNFVTSTAFWITAGLLVLYLYHGTERFNMIPWMYIEMVYCWAWAFLFFTAACDAAVWASSDISLGFGAFFGFVAMGIYAYDGFLKWQGWKNPVVAAGARPPV